MKKGAPPSRTERRAGAAGRFLEEKLSGGAVTFTLTELTRKTGLSAVAARNQLLHLGPWIERVAPRQEFFVIVSPQHRSMGAPPVFWWLDAYCKWARRPYYIALQSAAAEYRAAPQAIQVVQVMTDRKRRDLQLGRQRVQFFVKGRIAATQTQLLPNAYAPLAISTVESTCLDLIRYAQRIGGIGRAMESLLPLLPQIRHRAMRGALSAQDDLPTAQRLGYILDLFEFQKLSVAVRRQLPAQLKTVAFETHLGKSTEESTRLDRQWGIEVNNRSEG